MPDTLTFAFTDIVNSTAKNLEIGDRAYQEIADKHDELIRSIVRPAELKTVGDSFMLRFDDPAEAVCKLVELQRQLERDPIKLGDESLSVRIGIHTGNPLPSPSATGQEDYRGNAVNQAARYENLARGGQILISELVRAHVRERTHELPSISYHDWGPYYLKGVGWRKVFEVLWDGKAPVAPSGSPQYRRRRFLAPFVGRERELNDIQRYLANSDFPLITLRGPGGIGKTRLADEIERRASQLFDDGTFFVELESTPNNPKSVEEQIRAKCGIGAGTTEDFFANKSALLILNNFESVLSAVIIVRELLKGCGGLRILATSQVPLQIPGEQIWPVDSLQRGDAKKMFLEYARRRDPDFEIFQGDEDHLEELLRLTDCIPYCLELAAAKIHPGCELQNIVRGIGDSLASLGGEMESPRHKSVPACLDWSFSLLGDREKELFPKLSVFQGGFLPTDVAAVCGLSEPDAETLLNSLLDSSLLRQTRGRFSLLRTASEYAGRKLGALRAGLRRRHAEHYLAVLEEADGKTRTKEHSKGFATIRGEFENCRIGILWAVESRDDETVLRYSHAFSGNLANVRRAAAQVQFCEMGLEASRRTTKKDVEARAQLDLGSAYSDLPTGDRGENLRKAISYYEAALRTYTERDYPDDWAATQVNLGNTYSNLPAGDRGENLRKAIRCHEAALRVYTEQDFPLNWAAAQNNLGIVYSDLRTGDRAENLRKAIECCEAALRVRTETDFPLAWGTTQVNLGNAYSNLPTGDRGENLSKAIEYYRAALRVHTERDSPLAWGITQNNLGSAYLKLRTGSRDENMRKAIECYEEALRVRTERDSPVEWAMTQNNLGNAYSSLLTGSRGENLRKAIQCYEAALRVHTEVDFPLDWGMTQNNLGLAYLDPPTGESAENVRRAIQCFEGAARGYRAAHLEKEASEIDARISELKARAK